MRAWVLPAAPAPGGQVQPAGRDDGRDGDVGGVEAADAPASDDDGLERVPNGQTVRTF